MGVTLGAMASPSIRHVKICKKNISDSTSKKIYMKHSNSQIVKDLNSRNE